MGNTSAAQSSTENRESDSDTPVPAIVNPEVHKEETPSAVPVLTERVNEDPDAANQGPSSPPENIVEITVVDDSNKEKEPDTENAAESAEAEDSKENRPPQLGAQEAQVIRFLPKAKDDKVVLIDEDGSRFRADNSILKADADGVFYRYSKLFEDRDNKRPLIRWGASVAGKDVGGGWVEVDMATEDLREPEKTEDRPDPEKEKEKEPFQDKMYRLACSKLQQPMADVPGLGPRRPSSENISFDAYTKMHRSEFNRILALEKPEGWEFKKDEDGVKVYTKEEDGQDLLYFKGVSDFEAPQGPLDILMNILKTEDRPKWDELCIKGETPQFFAPYYKYAYCQLKARAGIISARDLVTVGRLRFEKDGAIVITIQSTYHEDYSEQPGFVRMNFIEGGYIVRPKQDQPGWVTVTWTGCVDPKGWIPTFLVNLLVAKQALTLAKIKEHMAANPPPQL